MPEGQKVSEIEGNADVRVACATPPGAGGIAVVQVVGTGAAQIVAPLLRARQPLLPQQMGESELRLARVMDGNETIDEAIVAVHRNAEGQTIIDLNLHGGPRVVQRVLLLLRRAGARIVEPSELLRDNWPKATALEGDLLPILLHSKTRPVAKWLAAMPAKLETAVQCVLANINKIDISAARITIAALCEGWTRLGYLLDGVRAVLAGGPNVGKSTLANALADREGALVSNMAGTTRDWVEHAGSVDGVPFTFVDTAGLRETRDEIEAEAVRRARAQIASADVLLWVMDRSSPPTAEDRQEIAAVMGLSTGDQDSRSEGAAASRQRRCLLVWNKSDLMCDPEQRELHRQAGQLGVAASAFSGEGLSELRGRLLGVLGLWDWRALVTPLTAKQATCCQRALSELAGEAPAVERAAALMEQVLADQPPGTMGQCRV